FSLPEYLSTRDLVLNVLLKHNGNKVSISRSVPIVLDKIDLQFFPESGKLIAGTSNRIAFKAIDEFGKPVDTRGTIVNASGKVLTSFQSFHDGMGSFELNPSVDEQYFAQLSDPFIAKDKIPLPKVYKNGVRFRLKTDSLNTRVDIYSTLDQPLWLEVLNDQQLIHKQKIASGQKSIVLDTKAFPIGITAFTIKDENLFPLAERLAFLNAHRQLYIDIKLDQKVYQTREKVKLHIRTKDQHNEPIPANLSIAVTDKKLLSFADDKQDHILSYLLLSSEIKGRLHEPSFYLNPQEKKAQAALDYVMLTHGWRDYVRTPINLQEAVFKPEQLMVRTGQTTDLKGRPVRANILVFDTSSDRVLVLQTDDKGLFSFRMSGVNSAIVVAYTEDGQRLKILEEKEQTRDGITDIGQQNESISKVGKFPSKRNNATQKGLSQQAEGSLVLQTSAEMFDELVVTGLGTSPRRNFAASVSYLDIDPQNDASSIAELLAGRIAGVELRGDQPIYGNGMGVELRNASAISGINQPLIVIDGIPYDYQVLSSLPVNEVESVTVLKNAAATMLYGSTASNGVLVITTNHQQYHQYGWKKKSFQKKRFKNYSIRRYQNNRYQGFYYPKKFYVPKYDQKPVTEVRRDFRPTIYWNPVVQTDEQGTATLEFYNSDAITAFQITAAGVGYNGLLGREKKAYATKKLLSIDIKVPNYMVLHDTMLLPVTLLNDSDQDIQAKVTIQLPGQLQLLTGPEQDISIKANSFTTQFIKVVPVEKVEKLWIGLAVQSQKFSDFVKKESIILSPYFPIEVSVSGINTQSFRFAVDNMVAGSLEADFKIYSDVIGEVMDGIESLIRQPYGCFEQTSSATYPNIMVLKYLKESKKVRWNIESKAMNFIRSGYERLVSFET
ncbi:MAG: TonB-dependent receptor plug domain-containing protein, partial [Bacteroidota bacterium]